MNITNPSLRSHLIDLSIHYDLPTLFDDFLSYCICMTQPHKVPDRPEDTATLLMLVAKYVKEGGILKFDAAYRCMLTEVAYDPHRRIGDPLGDFYEEYILGYDPADPHASWDADDHILRIHAPEVPRTGITAGTEDIKLFDELCGSGRRLLSRRWMQSVEGYYGMDISPTCAKMTILNLFLQGVPKAEVLAVTVGDEVTYFHSGFRFSRESAGIEEVRRQKDSAVWNIADSPDLHRIF